MAKRNKQILTLAIIQARCASTRLPNKVLLDLGGKTVLENVIDRVRNARLVDDIVVATTTNTEDQAIIELCNKNHTKAFAGSQNDVLDRFYQIAKKLKPKNIVRITADCPLIDPQIIDRVIETHIKNESDYTSNSIVPTFPDGLDVEVVKTEVLTEARHKAKLDSEREHVTLYIRNNALQYKIINVTADYSHLRWTLDNKEDYQLLQKIIKGMSSGNIFHMADVLAYLNKHPELEKINGDIGRNEGLKKSLADDKKKKTK